jgi:hypothetical protein
MPYIKQEERFKWDHWFTLMPAWGASGDMAYVITRLLQSYVNQYGTNYSTYALLCGVLETVKLEFYRRCIAPYEDGKRGSNGDVF